MKINPLPLLISICVLAMLSFVEKVRAEEFSRAMKNQKVAEAIAKVQRDVTIENLESAWGEVCYGPPSRFSLKDWPIVRSEILRGSLQLLALARSKYNPKPYDGPDPTINVAVPGIPIAGMDPAGVKDPKIRKEYETAIAENTHKMKLLTYQGGLEQFCHKSINHIERLVIGNYKPSERGEARKIIIEVLGAETAKALELDRFGTGAKDEDRYRH